MPGTKQQQPWTDSTAIFLLISRSSRGPVGFYDAGGGNMFTFAFTTQEKAKDFLKEAKRLGIAKDVDRLLPITIGEFFEWKSTGKTTSELSIDPSPDMLRHSVMTANAFRHN
jgi:hypothetical protein